MSSCREGVVAVLIAAALTAGAAQGQTFPGVGRPATAKELSAWDIDVRPDFKGLPKGSGSVSRGQDLWESKCASCHGIFGESNEVFSPVVGGTGKADIETGRVARLRDESFPQRTTMMKLSSLSSLWDYINRAMPWNQPKSLTSDEVYAVTAFILNLAGVVADDFTLSDRNIAEVQKRLPNRNGMTTEHALWPGDGFGRRAPDVRATACVRDCGPEPKVASSLPDHARNAHGNLAEQNRLVGAQRGADTTQPAPTTLAEVAARATTVGLAAAAPRTEPAALALAKQHACTACHGIDNRLVGPSFVEVARRHAGRADLVDYLAGRIKAGGAGVWGPVPMPPQSLGDADARAIAQWLAAGAIP
jgi:cytochrome c551/c552